MKIVILPNMNALQKIGRWLAVLLAEEIFMWVLVSTLPLAYGVALAVLGVVKGWSWDMFSLLPPLFLPILAFLVLVISVVQIFRILRNPRALRKAMQNAYSHIQRVHKPGVINPEHPGNSEYMKEAAQDVIDDLSYLLARHGHDKDLPAPIDISSKDSIRKWYEYTRINRHRFGLVEK